ncbi:MAG: HAD family hydrolase [Brachybacterium sp.]|nr:HAD family hydrolase [Brachybacterium sp.]
MSALENRLSSVLRPLIGRDLLLGLDVDGTLVDHSGAMSERLHDALQRAAGRHHVVIATGRSVGATLPIVQAAGITRGHAVCSNGAVTLEIDPSAADGFRVIDTRTFDPAEALRVLHEAAPSAHFAVETADGKFFSTQAFQDPSFGVIAHESHIEALQDLTAVRVVVYSPDIPTGEFTELVAEAGVHGVEYAVGTTSWLDMAAPGVSKATALEFVRERLGVDPDATLTIGDGWNDTEMLTWATVGVAMGQALPGIQEVADVVTATIWDDGAAEVLEILQGTD